MEAFKNWDYCRDEMIPFLLEFLIYLFFARKAHASEVNQQEHRYEHIDGVTSDAEGFVESEVYLR